MKIRPIPPQPIPTTDVLVARLKQCNDLVQTYYKARQDHNVQAAHSARLGISLFVPCGVYKRADVESEEHCAVYGVIRSSTKLVSAERLFVVPIIPVREVSQVGSFAGKWSTMPLVDTDGFLVPVGRDGAPYRPRFQRVGEIVHF